MNYIGIVGSVFNAPVTGTAPLHHYVNSRNKNHFYTTNWNELESGKRDFLYSGVLCYIFKDPQTGAVPLHRYFNTRHHLYTSNWTELENGESYRYEGIAGYIFPPQIPPPNPCVPENPPITSSV